MKIYIPFNSNDFNNIFSTLSISPAGFYPLRGYGFKRVYGCLFNSYDFSLLGYSKPIFSQKDYDRDNGYIINIELDFPEKKLIKANFKGSDLYEIKETVYLFEEFKLIFRKESELAETFARSLKSIETKFHYLARRNSMLVTAYEDIIWMQNGYKLKIKDLLPENISFEHERNTNKILGATLGHVIGLQNSVGGEFSKLKALKRDLENLTSVFSNSIILKSGNGEKERILICLNEIFKFYEQISTLDEELIFNSSGFSSSDIAKLGLGTLYGVNALSLIKEGLMRINPTNLPMQLRIEQTRRNIETSFNSKYPDAYLSRIEENINQIRSGIDSLIGQKQLNQDLTEERLLILKGVNPIELKTSSIDNDIEKKYFDSVLDFFVTQDKITSSETFFSERGNILSRLGNHLKQTVPEFEGSEEKKFLLVLFESFKNLRSSFDPKISNYETFKSLAVLFTSGRDLLKYFDNVSFAGVERLSISLSIWGAVYGLSSLPKTFTDDIFGQPNKSNLVIDALRLNLTTLNEKADEKLDSLKEPEGISVQPANPTHLVDKSIDRSKERLFEIKIKEREEVLRIQAVHFEKLLRADKDLNNDDVISSVKNALFESSDILRLDDLKVSDASLVKNFEQSLKNKSKKIVVLSNKSNMKKVVGYYKVVLKAYNS